MKIKFSIRHLLIAVALFAVLFSWLVYELERIQKRRQIAADLLKTWEGLNLMWQGHVTLIACDYPNELSWIRRLLGDQNFGTTYIPDEAPKDLIEKAKTVFWIGTLESAERQFDPPDKQTPQAIR
jgi:hypothetical protein